MSIDRSKIVVQYRKIPLNYKAGKEEYTDWTSSCAFTPSRSPSPDLGADYNYRTNADNPDPKSVSPCSSSSGSPPSSPAASYVHVDTAAVALSQDHCSQLPALAARPKGRTLLRHPASDDRTAGISQFELSDVRNEEPSLVPAFPTTSRADIIAISSELEDNGIQVPVSSYSVIGPRTQLTASALAHFEDLTSPSRTFSYIAHHDQHEMHEFAPLDSDRHHMGSVSSSISSEAYHLAILSAEDPSRASSVIAQDDLSDMDDFPDSASDCSRSVSSSLVSERRMLSILSEVAFPDAPNWEPGFHSSTLTSGHEHTAAPVSTSMEDDISEPGSRASTSSLIARGYDMVGPNEEEFPDIDFSQLFSRSPSPISDHDPIASPDLILSDASSESSSRSRYVTPDESPRAAPGLAISDDDRSGSGSHSSSIAGHFQYDAPEFRARLVAALEASQVDGSEPGSSPLSSIAGHTQPASPDAQFAAADEDMSDGGNSDSDTLSSASIARYAEYNIPATPAQLIAAVEPLSDSESSESGSLYSPAAGTASGSGQFHLVMHGPCMGCGHVSSNAWLSGPSPQRDTCERCGLSRVISQPNETSSSDELVFVDPDTLME